MRSATKLAQQCRNRFEFSSPVTTADIMKVLAYVAPPGQRQDLKRQVLRELWPGLTNSQGHHVADAVDNYGEF